MTLGKERDGSDYPGACSQMPKIVGFSMTSYPTSYRDFGIRGATTVSHGSY
jgi:hypothetical protein